MRKFFIIISGIYVLLIGVFLLLFLALFAVNPERVVTEAAAKGVRPATVILFIFAICPIATGIGIFLKKNWARISLLIMASIAALSGAIILPIEVFRELSRRGLSGIQEISLFVILFTGVFLIFIPALFLIFFNRKSVREIFVPAGAYQSPIPFGVKFIAVSLGLGAIVTPLSVYYQYPLAAPLFFGITMSKPVSLIYALIFSIVDIYILIGFFRLNKKAWVVAIYSHIYLLLAAITQTFTFNQERLDMIASQYEKYSQGISLASHIYFSLLGVAFMLAILIYLFSKKNVFYQNKISAQ